ncbi:SDR family NAD(P)-dependent oxidoreductase [Paenibacillus daejeonensis]|uniref:SDR family NAD(P)-dependent oxidoreductase n=1 Tax=Paenibacillus daejeonensis TaxID=135193 RepID=UPI000375B94C|nr:SDR family NAD(P)-dependent oxidoreductase [Paenibacillus daejeonensis]
MTSYALVSGADRGLGLALVKALLDKGYHVFAGQYGETAEALEALDELSGGRLRRIRLDIGDGGSVQEAAREVAGTTDRLDLLINNAAILGNITATIQDDLDFEGMEEVYRINTLGSLRLSNAFIEPILRSETKLIVNISSEAGSIGNCKRTSWYGYCMSKAALNMQSQLIDNQILPQGGRVLVLHPGHVQTYMQGKLDASGRLTPAVSAALIIGMIEQRLADGETDKPLALKDTEGKVWSW